MLESLQPERQITSSAQSIRLESANLFNGSPMMIGSTPYEANIQEQYERLGRFVESFEAMVHEVRSSCILLLGQDDPKEPLHHIIFHHQSMTAKPLFEIFRAMTVRTISDEKFKKDHGLQAIAEDTFRGILAEISKEYMALSNLRNNLLHGTWFVGYVGEDANSPEFDVFKYVVNKEGIARVPLPRTATELADLSARCDETRDLVSLVLQCVPPCNEYYKITDHFNCVDGLWQRAWTWRHKQP